MKTIIKFLPGDRIIYNEKSNPKFSGQCGVIFEDKNHTSDIKDCWVLFDNKIYDKKLWRASYKHLIIIEETIENMIKKRVEKKWVEIFGE